MFVLYKVQHCIRTLPQKLKFKFVDCLKYSINTQFTNKIILDVGLCVGLFDFEKIGDSYILPVEGCTQTDVIFRIVVFRPFVGEVITGRIHSCSVKGVWISVVFFDDIFVAAENLPQPSRYVESSQHWVWDYEVEDRVAELFMEKGSDVRFKVVDMIFTDVPPTEKLPDGDANPYAGKQEKQLEPSYTIVATMNDCGLGCLSWWTSDEV